QMLAETEKLKEIYFVETSAPFGSWGGKLGEMSFNVMVEGIKSMSPFLAPILEITTEDYLKMVDSFDAETNDHET
ncbi:4578_t:CDS:2, partial [Ambispora leptoticha]